MLNASQKQLLTETVTRYAQQITPETEAYLEGRGFDKAARDTYLLGTVVDPHSGHEHAAGCLSIPYITPTGVVAVKFRRTDGGIPKYFYPTGEKVGMFNVRDLQIESELICICEGEIDTLTLSMIGLPAVGIAGVSQWKPHFPRMFDAYQRILIFADNDVKEDGRNPGMELAKRIKEDLDRAEVVHLPANTDVNDLYLQVGAEWFWERTGR